MKYNNVGLPEDEKSIKTRDGLSSYRNKWKCELDTKCVTTPYSV